MVKKLKCDFLCRAPVTVASGTGPRQVRMAECRGGRRPVSVPRAWRSHGCWSTSGRDERWSKRKKLPALFLCWSRNERWSRPASTYHKPGKTALQKSPLQVEMITDLKIPMNCCPMSYFCACCSLHPKKESQTLVLVRFSL